MASNLSNNRISKINLGNVDYHIKSIPFGATEQEWAEKDYIPSERELIVVDDNNLKFKLGNGQDKVANLPYVLDGYATEEYVENLYTKLNSNTVLGFYCIEDVAIVINGISKVYPANSNVEVAFVEGDTYEIIPTSDKSILQLNAFPGALGTYYPWLEGVRQFSNILFDMNDVNFYSKWSQGNQGSYQVQYAQYTNCIFWSDNPYVSDVSKRTNYTLYYTSQLPLCYSTIPDNTFKSFYLAFNVNSDPNWGNPVYRESFAKATWATQVFSYYGARTIGIFGHDDPDFNITLPKDCRGLMYQSTAIENAGTFDAINTTNFGATASSWQQAFGQCSSLRNLYIKNLKTNINVSWSPINRESIYFIISKAANTSAITISVSPYTYNLLKDSDFELATSKNITIKLVTTNYHEDRRLGEIANKADITYVDESIANLVNSAPDTLDTLGELAAAFGENKEVVDALNESIANKQNKNVIIYRDSETKKATMTAPQIMEKVRAGENVYYTPSLQAGTLHPYLEGSDTGVFFYSNYIDNTRAIGTGISISADGTITTETYQLDCYSKEEVDDLLEAKANVEEPRFSGSMGMNHTGELGWTSVSLGFANEASGMYCFAEGMGNKSTGNASHAEGTGTTASLDAAHAEGYGTLASNVGAHAEGANTKATGYGSHAEGSSTIASIEGQHVEGKYNIDDTTAIHIIGNGTSNSKRSNAHTVNLSGEAWFSGDVYTGSTSGTHKDNGSKKLATEEYVNAQIPSTENMLLKTEQVLTDDELTQVRSNLKFIGKSVEGQTFNINGTDIVAAANAEIFGDYENNKCTGQWSIVEGSTNIATGRACHVEGAQNQALNDGCHVEGVSCIASGYWSHAEGEMTRVTSYASHAEGSYTKMPDGTTRYGTASGYASHIEGGGCHAEASCSHSEGLATTTKGNYSHSEGRYTIASSPAQHVEGVANIEDAASTYIHIAGNGDWNARSNAHTLDWEGNAWFSGDVYIGSTSGVNKDEGSKKLATEEYVDNNKVDCSVENGVLIIK